MREEEVQEVGWEEGAKELERVEGGGGGEDGVDMEGPSRSMQPDGARHDEGREARVKEGFEMNVSEGRGGDGQEEKGGVG